MQLVMSNNLIIAAAGSGKTTELIKRAINKAEHGETVLITTFTEACEEEIKTKLLMESKGVVNNLITVQTWFSFLIKHGAKPYQSCVVDIEINGLILESGRSGIKYQTKAGQPVYWGEEENIEKFYFSSEGKVYSDKLAKFVMRCNEKSHGKVIKRISECFDNIFIDEVQDLAGYDLEFLKLLFDSPSNVLLVGDPRQATYSTNNAAKNKRFQKSEILNFFSDRSININIDDLSLNVNYRCLSDICDFSNTLYPNFSGTTSGNSESTNHDGVFLVEECLRDNYLYEYKPMQLRYSVRTMVNNNYYVLTFGKSKGLTFNRVLIYPTGPMVDWLINRQSELKPEPKAKFYVALTRAKYSVGIVLKREILKKLDGFNIYEPAI